jgi:hypothetical protein
MAAQLLRQGFQIRNQARPDLVTRVAIAIHRITFGQASGILHDVKPRLQLFMFGLEGVYLFQAVGSLRELGQSMKGSRVTHDRWVTAGPTPDRRQ